VNGNLSRNGQLITDEFSKYFASVVQNNHQVNATPNCENPITYLSKAFNKTYPTINLKCASSKLKLNSVALVRKRTTPTERPPLVGEVSANFCGLENITKSLKLKNSHGHDGI
jgi:hypothetical protein